MHDGLVLQYMVEKERDVLLSSRTLSRRAQQERELSLAAAITHRQTPSLAKQLGGLVAHLRGGFRTAGPRIGAPQA